MTSRLIVYMAFLALIYLTLNYSGYEFLMIFFYFLLLLPLLSFIGLVIARHFVTIQMHPKKRQVERGTDLTVYISANNPSILPLSTVSLSISHQDRSSIRESKRVRLRLSAFERERFAVIYHFINRGSYEIGIEEAKLRDSCGFFILPLAKRSLTARVTIDVWPRRVSLSTDAVSNVAELEAEVSRSAKTSQELDEVARLRVYQPGDKLKLVHWSVSARVQELQVREFEEARDLETAIILADAVPHTDSAAVLADAGSEVSLALVMQTALHGLPTRLILAGAIGEYDSTSLRVQGIDGIDIAANALAKQIPASIYQERLAIEENGTQLTLRTRLELDDIIKAHLPADTKIVYLIVYALDESLMAIVQTLMHQLTKLFLIYVGVDQSINLQAYQEAIGNFNVQIVQIDPKQYLLQEEGGEIDA